MKNRQLILTTAMVLSLQAAFGQTADIYAGEAFRFSEIPQYGTARFRALGGNQAALGGDASSIVSNPAGLGFYNRSELSISPSVVVNSASGNYIGSTLTDSKAKPVISQLGLVLASGDRNYNSRWKRSVFGITYMQTNNFSNRFSFGGRNNNTNSSFVQGFVNDANNSGLTGSQLDAEYDSQTGQANSLLGAAYQLFLIDGTPFTNSQGQEDSRAPYRRFDANVPRDQRNTYEANGASSQWTAAYAGNLDDKFYVGASISLTRLRFNSDNVFTETIVGGQVFNSNTQRDQLTVRGSGLNLALGMIYKVAPTLQVGATITTPTWSQFQETFEQSLSVSVKDPNLPVARNNIDVYPSDFNYTVTSPFRAAGGATIFLGQGTKSIGFLTATAEYVGYAGMRVGTNYYNSQGNTDFRNDVRSSIQRTYQNVINFRAGAEIRAGMMRFRAGAAYMPDPYTQKMDNIDRTKLLVSGGIGVRNERFFADITGSFNAAKSAFTPYTLPNSRDYASAEINNKLTTVTLSVGTFF